MKKLFKKNQVIITVLTMLVAIAGYLNYSGKADEMLGLTNGIEKENGSFEISQEDLLSENQKLSQGESGDYIDIMSMDGEGEDYAQGGSETVNNPGDAILTNGVLVSDFLAQAKLKREQTRGLNQESLLTIINNDSLEEAAKQVAIDQMVALTAAAEMESTIETLLLAKGFENTIVSILNDSVDVVVCRSSITDAERAQIEDIVKRKTMLTADHIVITLMELSE